MFVQVTIENVGVFFETQCNGVSKLARLACAKICGNLQSQFSIILCIFCNRR